LESRRIGLHNPAIEPGIFASDWRLIMKVILAASLALAIMVSPVSAQKKDPFSDRVAELEALVATLQTELDALRGRVSNNEGNIGINGSGIATNASAIATNGSGIAANASAIGINASAIAANASAIATNGSGIATNTSEIGTLRDDVFGSGLSTVVSRLGGLEAIDHAGLAAQIGNNAAQISSILDSDIPGFASSISQLIDADTLQNQKLFDLDIRALGHEEQATELLIRVLGLDEAIGIVERVGTFRDSAIQQNVYDTFFELHGADANFAAIVLPTIEDWNESIDVATLKLNSMVCEMGLVGSLSGVGCPPGTVSRFPATDMASIFDSFDRLVLVQTAVTDYFAERTAAYTILDGGALLDLSDSDALKVHLGVMYNRLAVIGSQWSALKKEIEVCNANLDCPFFNDDLFFYTAFGSFEPVILTLVESSACTSDSQPTKATIYGGGTFASECAEN